MADQQTSPPMSLLAATRPDREAAPLVVSSDLLVLMLRFVGTLRSLTLLPALENAPAATEIKATVVDLERSVTSLLKAVDELTEDGSRGCRRTAS